MNFVGSCNTLNSLSNKLLVPNKREDLNIHVFNMITGINQSKILAKHVCECKCKFDGRKCNSNQKWNNKKFRWNIKQNKNIYHYFKSQITKYNKLYIDNVNSKWVIK